MLYDLASIYLNFEYRALFADQATPAEAKVKDAKVAAAQMFGHQIISDISLQNENCDLFTSQSSQNFAILSELRTKLSYSKDVKATLLGREAMFYENDVGKNDDFSDAGNSGFNKRQAALNNSTWRRSQVHLKHDVLGINALVPSTLGRLLLQSSAVQG